MPTAILSTYTGDGFIVTADGMAQGTTPTLSRKKIFQFGGNKWLAYAFAGRVGIGTKEGPKFSFDFRTAIGERAQALSINRFATLAAYAARLAEDTQRMLREACRKDQITFHDTDGVLDIVLAEIIISGYFKEEAATVQIKFSRHNRRFSKPEVITHNLVMPVRIGSVLMDLLFTQKTHPLYHRCRRPPSVPAPHLSEAMTNAIIESRAYIEACETDEARKLDDACFKIGGKIHMVSITPTEGIQWVPGFEHEDNL
jgi:hypothetical protein